MFQYNNNNIILKPVVERIPFGEARVLLLEPLLTGFQIGVLYAVHARIGLKHERLENALVLDSLAGQHDLDEILRRDAVESKVAGQPLHGAPEFDLGVNPGRGSTCAYLVLGPLQHGLEFAHLGHLEIARHDHLHDGLGQRQEVGTLEHLTRPRLDEQQDHVDQLGGAGVAPVIVLQEAQHTANLYTAKINRFQYILIPLEEHHIIKIYEPLRSSRIVWRDGSKLATIPVGRSARRRI